MTKKYDKTKQRVDYFDEGLRYLCREKDLVRKVDAERLSTPWRQKMEAILEAWQVPGFEGFIQNGYMTKYIKGMDFHGNPVFTMDGKALSCPVDSALKLKVLPIFAGAIAAGEKTGFTLGDMTCGNLLTDGDEIILIDYDVIVSWPLSLPYVRLWNRTLRIIFG